MKQLVNILTIKWVYLLLIPLIIFLLGSFFAMQHILSYDVHFTVMPVVQDSVKLEIPGERFVDKNVIRGEFTATKNNLGSLSLRMRNINEDQSDDYKILFMIKEKGAAKWYSTNSYSGGQFHELSLFPFGFNLIQDSQGKTYVFEIVSDGANKNNAVTVDTNQKIVANYQLNKSDLKNPVFAIQYVIGKLVYISHNPGALLSLLIYYLPLYTYFFLIYERKTITIPAFISSMFLFKFIQGLITAPVVNVVNRLRYFLAKYDLLEEYKPLKTVSLLNIVLFAVMLIEIFLIDGTNNFLLLIIVLLWSITISAHKLQLQTSFLFAVGFLILCLILYILGFTVYAEKAAIWTYLFLVIGSVHGVITFRRTSDKKVVKKRV